jgi:hypothetical protein
MEASGARSAELSTDTVSYPRFLHMFINSYKADVELQKIKVELMGNECKDIPLSICYQFAKNQRRFVQFSFDSHTYIS